MSFERLNGTLRRLFGRLQIEAGRLGGTASESALEVNQTWNTTGNPTALKVNVTNTASGLSAKLIDLQVGGSTKFNVDKNGVMHANGIEHYLQGYVMFGLAGSACPVMVYSGSGGIIRVGNTGQIGFMPNSDSYNTANDTIFTRDSAGVFAQRNSTNAQEYRLYGTYTSATAYQRLSTKAIKQAVTCAAGASVTTTISIPKYTHLIGVTTRVTTAIGESNGTTGYQVGDGTDPDLWGAITGVALGTTSDRTNFTAVDALGPDGSDRTITLTAVGGNFDGTGVIEVCAFYLAAEAD